jgi:hypothetical protein
LSKIKTLLNNIGEKLTDENYHSNARIFYNLAKRPDIETLTLEKFLEIFKEEWRF